MSASLVSIIGPPAVGKTTLAYALSHALKARLILEDFAGNPFLAESYLGARDADLPSQLHFLLSRVGQLSRQAWADEGVCVSDYGFCQDRVFAENRLSPADMTVYNAVAERLTPLVHRPEATIVLDASTATLLERIARRGRDYEKVMTGEFLQQMRDAYVRLRPALPGAVLEVDCDRTDLRDPDELDRMVQRVREVVG